MYMVYTIVAKIRDTTFFGGAEIIFSYLKFSVYLFSTTGDHELFIGFPIVLVYTSTNTEPDFFY